MKIMMNLKKFKLNVKEEIKEKIEYIIEDFIFLNNPKKLTFLKYLVENDEEIKK